MLALMSRGSKYLLLIDVDFHGSRKALIETQRYSPFELGLGRLVSTDKAPCVGHAALVDEQRRGSSRMIVGLELDWTEVEALYELVALAPVAPAAASRVAVPVRRDGRQVGRATTTAWSPTLRLIGRPRSTRPLC
jgi:aminomethyltransferase